MTDNRAVAYDITLETALARPMAAVRREVRVGEVGSAWRPALDRVWAFLRRHEGLRADGHNIFVYHHPTTPGGPMRVDFGVEVARAFEDEDGVVCTQTPAGQVASTLHVGPPANLGEANDAIEAWAAAHGHMLGGISWEIYSDPGENPATFEVRVSYLLA
jgi:effector-binding domain-containing protein